MKTFKKIISFIITYNIIFIIFLNLQYIYRFEREYEIFSSLMYSSLFSLSFTIIPLITFGFSLFIFKKVLPQKIQINSVLNLALIISFNITLSYLFMKVMEYDSFISLITIITTILTLIILFFIFQKDKFIRVKIKG